jgi:outer membrane murein-binding lipoprotein Lpp
VKKSAVGFAIMFSLALSGCMTAEQRQADTARYEQLHAAALTLATKVDRGEITREEAAQQLVQMEFISSDDLHLTPPQGAATQAQIATSMMR